MRHLKDVSDIYEFLELNIQFPMWDKRFFLTAFATGKEKRA